MLRSKLYAIKYKRKKIVGIICEKIQSVTSNYQMYSVMRSHVKYSTDGAKKICVRDRFKITPAPLIWRNWFSDLKVVQAGSVRCLSLCVFHVLFPMWKQNNSFSCILLIYYFPEYPIQKTFFLWLNRLTFGCTFFFLGIVQEI